MMNKEKTNQPKVFTPILNSNTLLCKETGEVKYLTVMVYDADQSYDEFIVQ